MKSHSRFISKALRAAYNLRYRAIWDLFQKC